jgi:intron-binding protein aquarius
VCVLSGAHQLAVAAGADDVYETFNVFLRRNPKENNFKAILETIRSLMNTTCVVPDWLQDVVLGFGDPSAAHYSALKSHVRVWVNTRFHVHIF